MGLGKEIGIRLLHLSTASAPAASAEPLKQNSSWALLTSSLRSEVEELVATHPLAKSQQLNGALLDDSTRFRLWTSLPPTLDVVLIHDVPKAAVLTTGTVQGPTGDTPINGPTFQMSDTEFAEGDHLRTPAEVVERYLSLVADYFERLQGDVNIKKRQQTETIRRQTKLWACLIGLIYAIYGTFTSLQRGNAVFTLIIAGFTLITVWPDPGKFAGDLSNPARLLIRSIRELSWKRVLLYSAEILRRVFRRSDGVVRFLLVAISVGGTAVVMKYGIRNFFLPDFIDIWIKRLGPAAALIVVVLYPSYLISKRVFLLSMNEHDAACRKYELCFYVSVMLLVLTMTAFCFGVPFEDVMQSVGIKSRRDGGPPVMWRYDGTTIRYLGSMCIIWWIWSIGFGACVVSRFFEVAWRDTPQR